MNAAGEVAPAPRSPRPGLALGLAAVILVGLVAFGQWWHFVTADRIDDSDPMIGLGFVVVLASVPGLLVLAGAVLELARGGGSAHTWAVTGWLLLGPYLAFAVLVAVLVGVFPPHWVDNYGDR